LYANSVPPWEAATAFSAGNFRPRLPNKPTIVMFRLGKSVAIEGPLDHSDHEIFERLIAMAGSPTQRQRI
jgi:hypothetical protein